MRGFQEEASGLLACVLCLMIPCYLALFGRIYVRIKNKAWGADDWCMAYAGFPFFIECLSGILGAYYGLGKHQVELSAEELRDALLWWNIFAFFYCNSTLPIKLGISWQICRIAQNNRKVLRAIYIMMFLNSLTLLMVFIFQLSQCHPVAYNWDKTIPGGHCLNQKYLTIISYVMSGVNITTDWITACLPIPLLWNVQMKREKKILVGVLLGLGVLGSIAALVRLKYTVALSNATDFTYNIGTLACWTIAEPGLGYAAANLATLRPLYRRLTGMSTSQDEYSGHKSNSQPWRSNGTAGRTDNYLELESHKVRGTETHISSISRRNSSASILAESEWQPGKAPKPKKDSKIKVDREVHITHEIV